MIQTICQLQPLIDEEMVKADAKSRDRVAVKGDHGVTERDRQQQAREGIEMENGYLTAARRCERAFHTEPYDQDDRERAEHAVSHALKQVGMVRHELSQERKEIVERARRHNSPLRHWPLRGDRLRACARRA